MESQGDDINICELILKCIQNYPFLYDVVHRDYKNSIKKHHAWKELAKIAHINVSECQKRWKSLRDRYTREKRQERKSGWSSKWYYFDKMVFYDKHTRPRKTFTVTPKVKVEETWEAQSSESSSRSSLWSAMCPTTSTEHPSVPEVEENTEPLEDLALTGPEVMPEASKVKVKHSHHSKKRKITTVQEDDLVQMANLDQKIAEGVSHTTKVCTERQPQTLPNRTFVEHLYSLLEEMSPEEAKKKRRSILIAMYDM